jgi:hypothetical protein
MGTLYTAMEVMSYGGVLVGGPLLASAFRWGMRLGDFWMGLPFLVAAGFFLLAVLALAIAAARKGGHVRQDAGTAAGGLFSEDDATSADENINRVGI